MKSLKLSKEDALVRSKWRQLIRGIKKIVMVAGIIVSDCFWYWLARVTLD